MQSAQDELVELWLNATDRNAVTAAGAIDRDLGENAPIKGSELSEGLRSFFAPPLAAIFVMREEDRIAEVLRVRSI